MSPAAAASRSCLTIRTPLVTALGKASGAYTAKESAPPAGEASKPGAVVSEEAAEPSEGKKKTVATLVMAKLGEMWRALDEAGKKVMNQICLVHVVIVCCLTPNFC